MPIADWLLRTLAEASCGAAIRVKPKVRLCEPWVMIRYLWRAAKRRQRIRVMLQPLIAVAPSGLDHFRWFAPKARKALPWA